MDPLERIRNEFTRQADTFDAYAPNADVSVATRFSDALGEAGQGRILDLACGPGVVSAALAKTARQVIGLDATPAMLEKARARCADAGIANVEFCEGDATALPYEPGTFDAVVTRLSIHHFETPAAVVAQAHRALRPSGRLVVADVLVSDDPGEAALQNAIEHLRDPSHVRMFPQHGLEDLVSGAGFSILSTSTWEKSRELEEWMGIANDPRRAQSLRTVARTLAEDGRTAGMGLCIENDTIVFFHRWHMITAEKT